MLWKLADEIWGLGAIWSAYFVLTIVLVILLVQLGWSVYRYITDMEEGEGEYDHQRRKLFCGDFDKFVPEGLPFNGVDKYELGLGFGALFVYTLIWLMGCLIWPVTVVYILAHGSLFMIRGMVRFKKKVNASLANKASKDHNHDSRYKKVNNKA